MHFLAPIDSLRFFFALRRPKPPRKKVFLKQFFFLCIFLHSFQRRFFFVYIISLVCSVVGVFVSFKKTSKGYNNFFRLCSHTHKLLSYFSCLIHVVFRYTLKKASFSFFFFWSVHHHNFILFFSTSSIIAAAVGASAFSCPIFVGEEKIFFFVIFFTFFPSLVKFRFCSFHIFLFEG